VAARAERDIAMKTTLAHFPFVKTLDQFDFAAQPSVSERQVRELATGRFVAHGENCLRLGPPGVGKTHLAIALGLAAIALGLAAIALGLAAIALGLAAIALGLAAIAPGLAAIALGLAAIAPGISVYFLTVADLGEMLHRDLKEDRRGGPSACAPYASRGSSSSTRWATSRSTVWWRSSSSRS
jgi:DNA replication protein DnaC